VQDVIDRRTHGNQPKPAADEQQSLPRNPSSTGKCVPKGPRIPTLAPGFNWCSAFETLPTFRITSRRGPSAVGETRPRWAPPRSPEPTPRQTARLMSEILAGVERERHEPLQGGRRLGANHRGRLRQVHVCVFELARVI